MHWVYTIAALLPSAPAATPQPGPILDLRITGYVLSTCRLVAGMKKRARARRIADWPSGRTSLAKADPRERESCSDERRDAVTLTTASRVLAAAPAAFRYDL